MSVPAWLGTPRFFRYWVGYGGIVYGLLTLALAAMAGGWWLALTLLLWCLWWWETATGFCRRCTHFNCGPHGALMRRWFARDSRPLPPWRRTLHGAADLAMFAWAQPWAWQSPWLGATTLAWLAVAMVAVYPFSGQARRDAAKFGGHPPAAGVR